MIRNATMRNDKTPAKSLGRLEQAVMDIVWTQGKVTADEVRERLRPKLKDSTVRTVLRRLEEKEFVTHTVDGRTYLYRAAEPRQRIAARAVQSIINRFCSGSLEQLLVGMVDTDMVHGDELERLAKKIAASKEGNS